MELWLAVLLFATNVADDVLAVLFVRRTAAGKALQAALISGLLTIFIAFSVVNYVRNAQYLIPIVSGSIVGCYFAVRWDKAYQRKNMEEESPMPIYSYECTNCGQVTEDIRKLNDRMRCMACPECGSRSKFTLTTFAKPMTHLYPYIDEYMDHNPIEIRSLKHRREELKKRGLQESGVRKGHKGQWV